MWLITSWGKSQSLIRPCLPFAADFCLMLLGCFTPSHCIYNWGHGLFSTRSPCFTDPSGSEWRHDSDVCSVGVSKAEFPRVAVNLFVYILTTEKSQWDIVVCGQSDRSDLMIFATIISPPASILFLIPVSLRFMIVLLLVSQKLFEKNPCLKCNDSHKPALLHKIPMFLFPPVCQKKKVALSISVFFPPSHCEMKDASHHVDFKSVCHFHPGWARRRKDAGGEVEGENERRMLFSVHLIAVWLQLLLVGLSLTNRSLSSLEAFCNQISGPTLPM